MNDCRRAGVYLAAADKGICIDPAPPGIAGGYACTPAAARYMTALSTLSALRFGYHFLGWLMWK
ncbi:MAG: hypothetical protein R2830_19350 [Saprospiraceae bacterium]